MPSVGFEPTVSVLERAKTVRALERAATAIGWQRYRKYIFFYAECRVHRITLGDAGFVKWKLPIEF
jgi:hypothetical protein